MPVSVVPGHDDPDQDYYLVRDLDTTPGIFRQDALFDDIRDARREIVAAD